MYGRKNCKLLLVNTEILKMSTDRQFVLAELEQPCSLTVRRIKVFPVRASPALDKPLVSLSLSLNRNASAVVLAPSLKEVQCNCSRGTHGVPITKYPKNPSQCGHEDQQQTYGWPCAADGLPQTFSLLDFGASFVSSSCPSGTLNVNHLTLNLHIPVNVFLLAYPELIS